MSNFHNTPASARVKRLDAIRAILTAHNISALIIPSSDPHLSEYLPEYWQGMSWVSGFTGSAGTLVITLDNAGLWTDSRYWVQATLQLDGTSINLHKITKDTPSYARFLADTLPQGASVAIDGAVLSLSEHKNLSATFDPKNITLITDLDILGEVWQERPNLPISPIYPHQREFTDLTTLDKLTNIRHAMTRSGADYHFISSLDDIAYITNLRGGDVDYNPVFLSHLLISHQHATLFVDETKLTADAHLVLHEAGITICPYDKMGEALGKLAGTLLIDPAKITIGTLSCLSQQATLLSATNPSTTLKAIKTPKEIKHIKSAMRQDGVALCNFFAWLEKRLTNGEALSELDIDDMLIQTRSRQPHYVSPSFATIAGMGANGAIVHYRATDEHFSYLDGDGLLLIDSGGQYQNGTTDITRMVGIGDITDAQKQDITYVLKAHIALARAHFPAGISAPLLDVLARNQLWQQGLDYGHSTGHGIGYFLNVHEGPQSISYHAPATTERTMRVGMITSNEPGLYRENQWGIRLENLMLCVPAGRSEFGEFLKFETLTLCPFDTRLILPHLLSPTEKDWLNAYHQHVYDELINELSDDAKAWLNARTQAI
ncbi:MAG: aminopeptidase P family protein [Moraxella sp.]|uniref:aminopeptidase P family protein n=1 Tax=Moraxella sp. TaxID=479 RepID=UPI0026DACD04|nr:aminopeptidase P family protein [Moraxella sp.]MDO4450583.1 aminopeptidase P family protein [Moraxella sp.]